MIVESDSDVGAKTPPYTPVVKRPLEASRLFDALDRVDPARTVYVAPSNPPGGGAERSRGGRKEQSS